jgi:hypothetical protein
MANADGVKMRREDDGDRIGCPPGDLGLGDEFEKMTSTFIRTSSAAASCSCSAVSDHRNSMTRLLPST